MPTLDDHLLPFEPAQSKETTARNRGSWKACFFILGTECCERFAFFGISTNLVSYLTTKLRQPNVSAATTATIWQGTCYLTPLLGAAFADSCSGKYCTILIFCLIYVLGMCVLTLSASLPSLKPTECSGTECPEPTFAQYAVFLSGLYLVAAGTGGIKPCVSPFGADQFDDDDQTERLNKGSFFNWFYFSIYIGILGASTFLVWIQDNVGWSLGFGIPALFMAIAVVAFLSGTPLYRVQESRGNPIARIFQVLVASCQKWSLKVPRDPTLLYEKPDASFPIDSSCKLEHSVTLRFLDKAAVIAAADIDVDTGHTSSPWRLCSVTQVEELKTLLRLFPIWATGIIFGTAYAQVSTSFLEQGMLMDTTVFSVAIPPASISTFDALAVLVLLPLYDLLIVPLATKLTGNSKGFTDLQRMGIGLVITALSMSCAAVVEGKRMCLTQELGSRLSVLWQVPQYFLMGASEIFTYIGLLEFFYEHAPGAMRSLCTALMLTTVSLGYYLNSLLLMAVTRFTAWFPDDLNKGRLDCFFWLLAGLCLVNTVAYMACARSFQAKKPSS